MKRLDSDIKALCAAVRALDGSSSRRTLEANLRYLWDRYLAHPSRETPAHLRAVPAAKKEGE